ncbi:MAG: hypothetical protein FWC75_04485 [Oscillospiraceae bacterium]|nr:hypothetical protein [Oscillospiraceae bacterium]
MKHYVKLLSVALCLMSIVAVLSIIYGFIAHGFLTMRYIFNVNFFIGVVLISGGIVLMFLPSSFDPRSKLLDRTTFAERGFDRREKRQQKARSVLWLGIFTVLLTGLIQVLLSVIL